MTVSRTRCDSCQRSISLYCGHCIRWAPNIENLISISSSSSSLSIPIAFFKGEKLSLPIPLVIIKDKRELENKSTSIHASLLAQPVSIIDYDHNLTNSSINDNFDDESVLLFPSKESKDINQIDIGKNIKRIIILDGTWKQAKALNNHPKLALIRRVKLSMEHKTLFWRYQSLGEHYLSTIEAIYWCYWELGYRNLENLLYLFKMQYNLIQRNYIDNPDKTFTSKHRSNYIKEDPCKL